MSARTPRERRTLASLAANTRAALYDGQEVTKRARDKRFEQFERQVDPNGELPPNERKRRARALQRAHMQRIARLAHASRARNKAATR